jgi:MoaA/NifB/PqqE/SkfB family radical SAM enzyme
MKDNLPNFGSNKQDILTGSSKIFSKENEPFNKHSYMIENMSENLAYKSYIDKNLTNDNDQKILNKFRERYIDYRKKWFSQPNKVYSQGYDKYLNNKKNIFPLCVDIEIASICDLGCPHCFREYIITPDKIMDEKLYQSIIDKVSELGVPSIKLNWRGEPLLHPKIDSFIKYAKQKGVLDVSINTNATNLDEKKIKELINSGLDQIIYSFDGGTKKTYEKMRPGRFKNNNFEKVFSNIELFSKIRSQMNAKFPTTKIQMVMTKDTREEVKDFFQLFQGIVDDVTVTQYNERGGNIEDLDETKKFELISFLKKNNLPINTPYIVDVDGQVSISKKRLPCEQLFQRMMVTFDGSIGMCCHDWGAQHCIGYVSDQAFEINETIDDLEKKIKDKKKGFELLKEAKKPKKFNEPKKEVKSLDQIWDGEELNNVRKEHFQNKVDTVEVCKNCSFKDTYEWQKI